MSCRMASSTTCTHTTRATRWCHGTASPKLERWKEKQGWNIPWYSSYGSDFNYDFGVTNEPGGHAACVQLPQQGGGRSLGTGVRRRAVRGTRPQLLPAGRRPRVPHVFTVRRGLESTGGSYYFLDLTALGRQEESRSRRVAASPCVPPPPTSRRSHHRFCVELHATESLLGFEHRLQPGLPDALDGGAQQAQVHPADELGVLLGEVWNGQLCSTTVPSSPVARLEATRGERIERGASTRRRARRFRGGRAHLVGEASAFGARGRPARS